MDLLPDVPKDPIHSDKTHRKNRQDKKTIMTDLEKNAFIQILRKTAVTRAELARKLGISRPTASTVAENLLKSGLIRECGKGKSTGGATPTLLSANENAFFHIGIDFGYTDSMSAVLIDGAGDIIRKDEIQFDPADINSITGCAAILAEKLGTGFKVNGVAVALSAIIDESSMRVINSINPLFCSPGLRGKLEQKLGHPVSFTNRSRAAAISEAFGGAADGETDFALISLGKSVGAAFWCSGKLFTGSGCSAGEIRNLRISGGERLENALSRERVAQLPRQVIVDICADALSQIIDIMDLKQLVLSGRFTDFGTGFSRQLEQALLPHRVRVKQSGFGRFSAARGSAFRMMENTVG